MASLASLCFLNTRPAEQARKLETLLQQQGIPSLNHPILAIESLANPPPQLSIDAIIFTSVNAVKSWQQQPSHLDFSEGVQFYAIGEATAQSLLALNVSVRHVVGESFTSESLLALPEMSNVNGKNVLLAKGEGGRDTLRNALVSRGAKVFEWNLYRRVAAPLKQAIWQAFIDSECPVLLVSSYESYQRLCEQLVQHQRAHELAKIRHAIVFSQRIADLMKADASPILSLIVVKEQSNSGIIAALEHIAEASE